MKLPTITHVALATSLLISLGSVSSLAADPPSTTINVSVAQSRQLGIATIEAETASEFQIADLPALILPPANARIAVAATFPGTVLQVLAVEGQVVRKSQVLARIASRDIVQQAAELLQARSRLAVAASTSDRLSRLSAEGIVAGARAEEAQALHEQARADASAKLRVLQAVHADLEQGTYNLIAPIDGIVSTSKIQAGEPLELMSAPFVIDSNAAFEVQAQIPERLIGKISEGMRLILPNGVTATVTSVGSVIQPETRSALLKAQIVPGAKVIAGMSTNAAVFGKAPPGSVRLPRSAITTVDGRETVFVAVQNGYMPRTVETASSIGDTTVVLSGLKAGETVAKSGLTELKSMSLGRK